MAPACAASISLRKVSLSTVGVFVCAIRFLSEVILVLGGFTLSRSSGNGINVVSCFCLIGNDDWPVEIPFRHKDQQCNDDGMGDQGEPCCLSLAIGRDNIFFFRQISRKKMQTHLRRRDLHRRFCLPLAFCRTPFFFHYRNKPPPACYRLCCIVSYYSLIRTALVRCSCGHQR